MDTLSDRIKQRRAELEITQIELAKKTGIAQQSLQKLESGATKRPRFLLELAQALNCDPRWLMYGETNNNAA